MRDSDTDLQEGTDRTIIEEINQLKKISLGVGAAACQVCASPLSEGDSVVVYVFRPAGEVMFQVGFVVCGGEDHGIPEVYTLGVRELVVEGRVGWCSDGAMQSSWPVLLDPEVVAVSAAATKSVRLVPDGGSPANGVSHVEESETPGSPAKESLGEAQRRAGRPDDDMVRGPFWGDER